MINEEQPMKFKLEGFLVDHLKNRSSMEEGERESNREVERLLTLGKYQEAYDLYESDGYADELMDYEEFVNSRTLSESNLD